MADKMFRIILDRADPDYELRLTMLRRQAERGMLLITESDSDRGHYFMAVGDARKVDALGVISEQLTGQTSSPIPDISKPVVEDGPLNIETGDMVVINPQSISRRKKA